jgi:hypothetical protein
MRYGVWRAIGTFLSLSAKTRLSQTQISTNRPPFVRWEIWRFPQSLFGFGRATDMHQQEVGALQNARFATYEGAVLVIGGCEEKSEFYLAGEPELHVMPKRHPQC